MGYLKRSFWIPFVASMRQAGLRPDKQLANARVHATTGDVPAARLAIERPLLWRYYTC